MARKRRKIDWLLLSLLLIPLLWIGLEEKRYKRLPPPPPPQNAEASAPPPPSAQLQFYGENGLLTPMENKSIDWRFQIRGEIPSDVPLIYVDIDTMAIQEMGNMPWDRGRFVLVCEALLNVGKVRAIGIDVVFSQRGASEIFKKLNADGDRRFARLVWSNPPVVTAVSYVATKFLYAGGWCSRFMPLIHLGIPPLEQIAPPEVPEFRMRGQPFTPTRLGLIDTIDMDTRWVPLFAPTAERYYYALSVEVVRAYLGLETIDATPEALIMRDDAGAEKLRVPLARQQLLEINWFSPWMSDPERHRSFTTIYKQAIRLDDPDETTRAKAIQWFETVFHNAIVLIGPVDPLLQDIARTPMDTSPAPRVGVHGNLIKTMLSGHFLKRTPQWLGPLIVLGLTLLVAGAVVLGGSHKLWFKLAGAAILLAAYAGLCQWLFGAYDLILPMAAPLGSALSTTFVALGLQLIREDRQKKRITHMFGSYVSPVLVNRLVESDREPELGGHDDVITCYFSDIQNFSTFSEILSSSQLVELLNEYLTACTDILQEQGGTLDKYIGDAVVAMFNAPVPLPDHAYRAALASQLVQRRVAELREKWISEGDRWPERVKQMHNRIGLNTGLATIGNMGSPSRFNYTMMGDNVNLGARMESGAKQWGAYTMCTDATRDECLKHGGDRIIFRPLGRIVVKGRTKPAPIFEITGLKEDVNDRTLECLAIFGQGLDKHHARDFSGAQELFRRSAELEPRVPGRDPGIASNPSLEYIKISGHFMLNPPPPDWDGVYHMTEK